MIIRIEESNPSFESCNECIYSDSSEETCILRQCIHAVAQLKECYVPKQPTIEPQRTAGHWIPCKKDHPIKPGHYLCSFDRANYTDKIYVGIAYWTGGRWYGYAEGAIEAWQPLPERYQEGES